MPPLPRGTKLAPSSQRARDSPAHSVSQSVDHTASRSRYGREERGRAMPAHFPSQSGDHKGHRSRYRAEDPISDSASSSGASDISGRSPTSAASSRTSIDEADMEDKMEHKTPAGAGSSLWASITGVASNLTISVSKAWSSNIQSYNGEDTPVGGESRLTRALKAYHIDKARDPADLPEWLFDERERGVRSYQTPSGAREKKMAQTQSTTELSRSVTTVQYHESLPPARTARGPTLADRKNSAALSGAGSDAHVTKSISRLRELRDAKRNAKVRFGDEMDEADEAFVPPPLPVAPPVVEPGEPRLPPPTRPRGMPATPLGASLGVRGRQPSARMGLPSGVRPVRA
ncbi:hypothetical protein C8Q74DRAFT_34223 [Fomes fomentarius]|nr:hypothetical protein C8Q74DRAFT_34223 [Fomes fomentarius]